MQWWNVTLTFVPADAAESVNMTHCVAAWWGEDAEQAGNTAPDAGEHSLTLHQGSVLQLSRRICTRSQQSILHRGQDEASTLREERKVRNKDRENLSRVGLKVQTRLKKQLVKNRFTTSCCIREFGIHPAVRLEV